VTVIACNQLKCKWLRKDLELGTHVCSTPNVRMTRVSTGRSFILNCGSYERRANWFPGKPDTGIPLTSCSFMGEDGLYPGQIKPQPDYSDFDPDEVSSNKWEDREAEAACDT